MSGRRRRKVDPQERAGDKKRRIKRFEKDARAAGRSNPRKIPRDKHNIIIKGGDDWMLKKIRKTFIDAPDGIQFRDS